MGKMNLKVAIALILILTDVCLSMKLGEPENSVSLPLGRILRGAEGSSLPSSLQGIQRSQSIRRRLLPQSSPRSNHTKRGIGTDLAQLSNNISLLLDRLLKNYNKHIRPGLTEGKTTVVKMNILIRSMGPINEKDMQYSMDCYLRQEWSDDRLRFEGPLQKLSLNIKMLEALWKPDTFFRNGLESYIHTITRPNKLFRIDQEGKILYSMRLTIKAKCPMKLRNFPMDVQSCPLRIGSYAYPASDVVYEWDKKQVSFSSGMALSQFDLLSHGCKNFTTKSQRGAGEYSTLQVNFLLQRHTGYFLIQVYIPCILIVVLSWVSFWINREATSDRIGLGITTVLTLSTISLDTRTDLPKVHYATALDWFILMSFGYCIATLLQFAGVHYFTKVGSGEVLTEEDFEVIDGNGSERKASLPLPVILSRMAGANAMESSTLPRARPRMKYHCDVFIMGSPTTEFYRNHPSNIGSSSIMMSGELNEPEDFEEERYPPPDAPDNIFDSPIFLPPPPQPKRSRETQTDKRDTFCTQLFHCMLGNDEYRRSRQKLASQEGSVNSVSVIDSLSRVLFPASYGLLNLWYWYSYLSEQDNNKKE